VPHVIRLEPFFQATEETESEQVLGLFESSLCRNRQHTALDSHAGWLSWLVKMLYVGCKERW